MIADLLALFFSFLISFNPVPAGYYRVVSISDGDTIKVLMNKKIETIRFIGVDTPETVDPRRPVQCFGKEASNFTKKTLSNTNVKLESDFIAGDRDKYKRLLRYVFLEDGQNFNQVLIEEGFGHEYTYKSQPYKYQNAFKRSEINARENSRGLWAPDACAKMN
ncbi:thermonuclease family protein [Candidatus Amesbacteria bacterium]|nr:thermonuclease family protein [Candidatus Amesbacteria bacterium]